MVEHTSLASLSQQLPEPVFVLAVFLRHHHNYTNGHQLMYKQTAN